MFVTPLTGTHGEMSLSGAEVPCAATKNLVPPGKVYISALTMDGEDILGRKGQEDSMILYEFWKKSLRILILIIVTSMLTLPAAVFAEDYLTVGGTGSALASIKILGQAFENSHPGIKVKIIPSVMSSLK